MPVIMFSPRFHDLVAAGTKRQTIRAPRKRPVRPGDSLSLRAWLGDPYRSKQRLLRLATCTAVEPVRIEVASYGRVRVELSGVFLPFEETRAFVQADGFEDIDDFWDWWTRVRKRVEPFDGELIRWEPLETPTC